MRQINYAEESTTADAERAPVSLAWTAAVVISCLALVTQARLSDFCWAVWLVDVLLLTAGFAFATGKAIFIITGYLPLPPFNLAYTEGSDGADKTAIQPTPLKLALSFAFLIIFNAAIYYGFFAFYGLLLQILFPLNGITPRQLSLTSFYLLLYDYIAILLRQLWPTVLFALLLNRRRFLNESPTTLPELLDHNITKISFSFLLGVPIALIIQNYFANWETATLIILILIFFAPKKTPVHARNQEALPEGRF